MLFNSLLFILLCAPVSGNALMKKAAYGDTLKITTSWNNHRMIVGNHENPSGLIGVYDKVLTGSIEICDTKQAVEFLRYPTTDSINFLTSSVGGFSLLNTEKKLYRSSEQFWIQFNKPWLQYLTSKRAVIYVLSNKNLDLLKWHNGVPGSWTGFGRELHFMDSLSSVKNYEWNELQGAYIPK